VRGTLRALSRATSDRRTLADAVQLEVVEADLHLVRAQRAERQGRPAVEVRPQLPIAPAPVVGDVEVGRARRLGPAHDGDRLVRVEQLAHVDEQLLAADDEQYGHAELAARLGDRGRLALLGPLGRRVDDDAVAPERLVAVAHVQLVREDRVELGQLQLGQTRVPERLGVPVEERVRVDGRRHRVRPGLGLPRTAGRRRRREGQRRSGRHRRAEGMHWRGARQHVVYGHERVRRRHRAPALIDQPEPGQNTRTSFGSRSTSMIPGPGAVAS